MERLRLLVVRLPVDPDVAGRADERLLPTAVAVALIAVGGALGALARGAIEAAAPAGTGFPWATLGVNATGALLLSLLLVVLEERLPSVRVARPLLGTGVLGGYTTYSTFAVEAVVLVRAGETTLAVGYVAASVLVALAAAAGGLVLGRAASRIGDPHRLERVARPAAPRAGSDAP